ncbi:hypothetical protein BGX24_005841 [Mortierella sp. AD032]|nr:hypothetical protein BGX24_005841 [Mortierella sp. AD032]
MDVSPYKVFDSVSTAHSTTTATATRGERPLRPPRNPQGKMRWHGGDSDDNEDEAADAEEIIDVDALIAEQERITRELAAQEESLRQEEEATILTKRLAAIRAAEKRGLLRFEGDQIVIPNGENSSNSSSKGVAIRSQDGTVQGHDGWSEQSNGKQGPHQRLSAAAARGKTTSSGASSFVGGVDAFNQELKMMDLDMSASRNTDRSGPQSSSSTTTATASTSTSTSTSTGPSTRRKTASTGVSTSTSTSTNSTPTVAINPREVFNNITSFLKKVDGVIAGEGGSSDEASFSDQEHVLGKSRANHVRGLQESQVHGPEEVNVSEAKLASVDEVPTVLRAVTPVPFDSANQEEEDEDEQPYPTDPFNATQTSELLDDNDNSSVRRDSQASKERITPDSPAAAEKKDTGKTKIETTVPASPVSPALYSPLSEVVAAVPERVFSTFTSIFNTGSSLMGLWGAGAGVGAGGAGVDGSDGKANGGVAADGRRLSNLKYGDPKKHRFNYQDHNNPSSSDQSQTVVGKHADDDDNSSIDDYDF